MVSSASQPCFSRNTLLIIALFSSTGNKSVEVKASDYEGKIVEPNEKLQFNACGRADSPSGTDGSFELVDPSEGDKLIRNFYWSCPYGDSGNQWIMGGSNSKWIVESSGQNVSSRGALGNVTTEVFKRGA